MGFGLCILGCGKFAKTFATSVQPFLTDIDLYFASRNLERAQSYSNAYNGLGAFGSYEEAISNTNIEAVYICTPHHMHVEHANLGASYGKHILVEKPISNNVEDAKAIISSASRNHVKLMVAENYRFMPSVRLCKKLIDQGAIGRVRVVQVQQESPYEPSDWRKNPDLNGGGVFIDAGIHKIHFLRYILGEPHQIYATAPNMAPEEKTGEDGMIFVAKWKSGEVGFIYHSWTSSEIETPLWISISGTLGRIHFELRENVFHIERGNQLETITLPDPLNGILPMTKEFLKSILDNRRPEMTGEEGLKDLILVTKAYESNRHGRSLEVIT